MVAMVACARIDAAHVEVVPDRRAAAAILIARQKRWLVAFCLLTLGLLPLAARAQITEPLLPLLPNPVPPEAPQARAGSPADQSISAGQTVIDRPRPEFDPIGLRVGDFFWFPRAELDGIYNNNIFAANVNPTRDFITAVQPSFDLLSILPRASFNLHGNSQLQFYARNPAQNTQDGSISVDGALPITAGSGLFGNAQVAHQHLSYGSPNSPGDIAQPVTYWSYLTRAGYAQGGRRFSYQVDVGVDASQFNATPLVGGGVLPQSSQNTIIPSAAVRTSYEIAPDYLAFVRVSAAWYNYWRAVANNSTTERINLGLQILPRHIVYGQVYAGYLLQNFAQSNPGSTSTSTSVPDYGGQLVWNVTRLTTLTFNGLRTFITGTPTAGGTNIIGPAGSGYLASTIAANADHELLRNLLLNFNAGYENDSFQGITRTDNVFTAGAGLKYMANRYLFLGGSFSYYQRSSTAAATSFSQNLLMLRVGTQF
jgi:hypothetical protein